MPFHLFNINNEDHFGDNVYLIHRPYILSNPYTHIKDKKTKAMFIVSSKEEAIKPAEELILSAYEACKKAPASHWTGDGVHPTPAGHEIIKRLWLETFEKMKNDNMKSFNIKMLSDNTNNYKFYNIPSTLRRVFMDTDYNKLFEYWEKEFEETGV